MGPTAAGKSALALGIAREADAEIVSCDSLQVYRGLDIGSAKPTKEERDVVPHHLIDVVDPDESFSAADYARLGRQALASIASRARISVVVGGTGLYLQALLFGLFEGPGRNPTLRRRLTRIADRYGHDRLHRMLARVDPAAASRVASRDRVRVIRALEVYRATGRTLSEHHRRHSSRPRASSGFATLVVGVAPDRATLRTRVERRTEAMFEAGLLDEVSGLLARGYHGGLPAMRAIGYRQAVAVVRGEIGAAEARRDIVRETMRYAKRQMTWFRHRSGATWTSSADQARDVVLAWLAGSVER
ncbi:MAG TPA: tRNA (adenosine(37)-N6)-dimethylallyltransferase MiaA [Vicinamibacteria bacterium]